MSVVNSLETQIQIRSFDQDDAAGVEFVVLSVLQEWGFLPSSKDQQEIEALYSQSPFDAFYVAVTPEIGVIGCAGIARLDEQSCELRKIYLLKRFRGQSIGQQLLNECLNEARSRGYQNLRIELNSTMATHSPFYQKNGFVQAVGEKPTNPSADYIFMKTL